jgi:hypothetical protein
MTMTVTSINAQTGAVSTRELTAEEIQEREAYERDVLPGLLLEQAKQQRATAYRNEADPLFFKAQRGEATIEEWQLKVAEIRSLYPYPNEEVQP